MIAGAASSYMTDLKLRRLQEMSASLRKASHEHELSPRAVAMQPAAETARGGALAARVSTYICKPKEGRLKAFQSRRMPAITRSEVRRARPRPRGRLSRVASVIRRLPLLVAAGLTAALAWSLWMLRPAARLLAPCARAPIPDADPDFAEDVTPRARKCVVAEYG